MMAFLTYHCSFSGIDSSQTNNTGLSRETVSYITSENTLFCCRLTLKVVNMFIYQPMIIKASRKISMFRINMHILYYTYSL